VAVLPVALYTAQANLQEPSDSTKAALATEVLLARLQELLGKQLIPPDQGTTIAASPEARARSGDQPCNVIVAWVRLVGDTLHAPWVVMAKVSKTSNLAPEERAARILAEVGRASADRFGRVPDAWSTRAAGVGREAIPAVVG
jgi:hypothetical protein